MSSVKSQAKVIQPLFVKVGIDLRRMTGIAISTQYAWIEEGKLPKPKRVGPRTQLIKVSELMEVLGNE